MITVKQLRTLEIQGLQKPDSFLFCSVCQSECSACAGDYFTLSLEHVFTCCNTPMILATKRTVIEPFKELPAHYLTPKGYAHMKFDVWIKTDGEWTKVASFDSEIERIKFISKLKDSNPTWEIRTSKPKEGK
jgi:hypothetical protein